MADYTFCIALAAHGYQRVVRYDGVNDAARVVLDCGHTPGLRELTYGIDEVLNDEPAPLTEAPAEPVAVPVAAALAAADALPPDAEWHDIVDAVAADPQLGESSA